MRLKRFGVVLVAGVCLGIVLLTLFHRAAAPDPAVRAIWVTRFDYVVPEDVSRIIANVADAGFTDVFFQIRGNATAFYRSELEPWAAELTSKNNAETTGKDPGWDPLAHAVGAARAAGVRIHAYANVMPGWRGNQDPPEEAGQLWTAHPEWFMVDRAGDRMKPTAGWYSFLNPAHPEVRRHLRGVFSELCRYDVDGIHLDYIRYPHDYHLVAEEHYPGLPHAALMEHATFSYDEVTRELFAEQHRGLSIDGKAFDLFRRDAVTAVVQDIYHVVRANKGEACLLTASVMGDMREGRRDAFQDSRRWVRQGMVDWAVTMNYSDKRFDSRLAAYAKEVGRSRLRSAMVVGILCEYDTDEIIRQIEAVNQSRCRGYALFAYSHLFGKDHLITEKGHLVLAALSVEGGG